MKTSTIILYFNDGKIDVAKNSSGFPIKLEEAQLQDMSITIGILKLDKIVAICNQDPHFNLVVIDSESK